MTEILHAGCAASYGALIAFVLLRTRPNASRVPLLLASLLTVAWSAAALAPPGSWHDAAGLLDLGQLAAWCGFALHLYRRFVPRSPQPARAFAVTGALIALMVGSATMIVTAGADREMSLLSVGIALRLGLAICQLLLLENLFRNTVEDALWNVNLVCVALGGLAIYDIVLCADAALFRHISPLLVDGRTLATLLVTPLLALSAVRAQRWTPSAPRLSRTAAFHSVSLVASGVLLLALAGVGEVFRAFGTQWGAIAEIGLVCGGVLGVAVLLSSGSGQSYIRALLIDPFFSERYDYRREWLRCLATLSGAGSAAPLHVRVTRAVAQVVDSPAGLLFLREPGGTAFQWSGSWNMPAVPQPMLPGHPLLETLGAGEEVVEPDPAMLLLPPTDALAGVWLAVPLWQAGSLSGFVLVARPRAPFSLDREVFALLRTVGREVAAYLAEQRATQALVEARELRDFGKRFAFVAHDIKNVSSQLSLLLANAEHHMENPEFRRDMLDTVRASVQKIGALLRRLQEPQGGQADAPVEPAARLQAMAEACRRLRGTDVRLEQDQRSGQVAIAAAAFDAIVTHLLDNAMEAAAPGTPIRIVLAYEPHRVLVDIVDRGAGMPPEFVRDELFQPFRTSKQDGSGIGAFQARELLREAGGDLIVLSRPGQGTTMRLVLPLAAVTAPLPA
jgi:putative PEP-CTERM system histidine kinase